MTVAPQCGYDFAQLSEVADAQAQQGIGVSSDSHGLAHLGPLHGFPKQGVDVRDVSREAQLNVRFDTRPDEIVVDVDRVARDDAGLLEPEDAATDRSGREPHRLRDIGWSMKNKSTTQQSPEEQRPDAMSIYEDPEPLRKICLDHAAVLLSRAVSGSQAG